ncbi:hypothetical protein KUV85_08630 [Nocardioides panacisoli]|uniref:hypothetical protein n=1 Tax=Nocardioides panacisoli TaxID=627624 RepID=UPI001C637AE9|nr:hypothetical protein [Nocardioides panacisoli]QYJ05728.1 hypothetical protein KUV85_08630 [Nocardioides panacisoli]
MPQPATADQSGEVLRPGCSVLLRDEDSVQVGLRPPLAVRLPRTHEVIALLRSLECGGAPPTPTAATTSALRALRSAGLLVPAETTTSPAARAQFGSTAAPRHHRRRRHHVAVRGSGAPEDLLTPLLDDAGLTRDDRAPTVVLVVATGTLRRSELDPLLRDGLPHLVVAHGPEGHRLGPFVDPGRTACLRCVDAAESADDPRLPLLLEQAAGADGVPPPDPLLERIALGWAVRDLARWAEGDQPSTWSTTVDIGPTAPPVLTPRLRHPHCGCAWDTLLA